MANKKETMKEMFDRMMADPNITESEMFKESKKFGKALDELTQAIVQPCLDYAEQHNEDDEGWSHTIMIALARATCKLTYAFQKTSEENGDDKDVFDYYMELLPLCKEIAYKESDEQMKMKEAIEKSEKDGVPFETKKELILAIADPSKTPEEIVAQFFNKEISDKKRQQILDCIDTMRRDHADKLKQVRDHTDENGNYKA